MTSPHELQLTGHECLTNSPFQVLLQRFLAFLAAQAHFFFLDSFESEWGIIDELLLITDIACDGTIFLHQFPLPHDIASTLDIF